MMKKVIQKIKKELSAKHSMADHPAEQYYFKAYWREIQPFLKAGQRVLEIGCSNGRFTIPLLEQNMEVVGTDIRPEYEKAIREKTGTKHFTYLNESIAETVLREDLQQFNLILCTELLYTMPNFIELLQSIQVRMNQDAVLICSHRSKGYYIYRYVREKKWKELNHILEGEHPVFNAQHPDELQEIYKKLGFTLIKQTSIGTFSGFGNDPFTSIADPSAMNTEDLRELLKLEAMPEISELFGKQARYQLIIAKKG